MSASEIKAGGAFVEIGAKTGGLDKALNSATANLQAFASGISSLGAKLAGIGAAMTVPLIGAAKHVADLAEETDNFQKKTGASLAGFAGLKALADGAGISMETVGSGLRKMQVGINDNSKETAAAFARLGTSAAELKGKTPEQAFALLGDRLNMLTDQNEKAAVAQDVFGRAGVDLLPILAAGSRGMAEATVTAKRLGNVLSQEQLDAALKADAAFDELALALRGFSNTIGSAVIPLITPLVKAFTEIIARTRQWIDENEDMVKAFFNVGAALATVGTAFMVLGAAISAALSPAILASVAILGVGTALLAVTDILGVTKTGFGDLFNSIRVDGVGLGTWITAFGNSVAQVWLTIEEIALDAWGGIQLGAELAIRSLESGFTILARAVVTPFEWMVDSIVDSFNLIIEAYNAVAAKLGGTPIDIKIKNPLASVTSGLDKNLSDNFKGGVSSMNSALDASDARGRDYNARRKFLANEGAGLFRKDPEDGSTGVSVDTDKLKSGLSQIGDNIFKSMNDALSTITSKLPELKTTPMTNPFDGLPPGKLGEKAATKTEFTSVGTFTGGLSGQLAGSDNRLDHLQTIAEYVKQTAANTRDLGGLA